MKHQIKRVMSMVLALVVLVSLFSGMAMTTSADNTAIQGDNGKTVAFIENGVLHSVQTVAVGTEVVLPDASQSVDSTYGFQGWVTEKVAQSEQKPAAVYAAGSSFTVNDHQVFYALYEYQVAKEEEIPEETTPEVNVTDPAALEAWNIDTVQLPARSVFWNTGADGKGTATGSSQNGTVFKTNVTFPANMTNEGHYVNFWIGEEGQGYVLAARPNTNTVDFLHYPSQFGLHLDPAVAGVDTFYGKELEVMISTEFVNTNGDTTDVNVGLYINGVLYSGDYLKITGAGVNDFPQNVFIISNTDVATTEVSVVETAVSVTPPEQLTGWDINTIQLPAHSIFWNTGIDGRGTPTGNSQNGSSFNATITFPAGMTSPSHYVNFWIGEEGNGYVFQAAANKDTLAFMHFPSGMSTTLYPSDFGLDTFVGVPLDMNLTTEFFNTNGDTTDVHTGLYINGKLYKNRYITITSASTAAFPQNVYILSNTDVATTNISVIEVPVTVTPPEQLDGWDIETVQLPMKSIDCFAGANGHGTATGKSQDGKSFEATITFPGDMTDPGHYVNFWIGEEGNGYVIQAAANKDTLAFLHFPSGMSATLQPSDFGMDTLVGVPLNLNLTTEFFNTNGDTTDVHTGLYINGKLYQNSYITITGTSTSAFPQNVYIINNADPGVTLVDVLITPPEQLKSWNVDTVQLPMKTIDCFAGNNGKGTATGKSQNGTSFEAKITFPGDITEASHYVNFWIGEESNGYVLQALANSSTLNFAHIPGGLSVVLQPSDFGMDTLVGVPLKVKLTTEFYNTNGDTTDVHVGLYINGKLYKNGYLTMKGVSTAAFPQNVSILNNVAPGVTLVDILGVDHYTTDIQGMSCEHSATEDSVIEANCSTQGYTCTRCSGCQAALSVGSFTAIGDHNWREWTQTVTPYYGVAGEETRACGICGETQTQTIAAFEGPVAFWNVSLKEDIGVNFVLALTDAQAEGATVTVAVGTVAKTENVSDLSRNEKGYYVISQSVAAAQMTESINVTVKMADNEVTSSYTVRQYADYILNAANGYDIATRQLVADMLHYGAAAQTYFNVNTQNLANNKVADLNANAVPAASEQTDVQMTGKVSGVKFYGATLLFKEHIAIRYYFTADNADSLAACTFAVAGQEYTPVKKDNLYYVQIDNVYPQDIDEMFELTVTDGENTMSVAYGAISYISRMYHKDSTSSELKTLLQQLYDYHLSAEGMVSTISSGKKKNNHCGVYGAQ